jgi:hypothetical protein
MSTKIIVAVPRVGAKQSSSRRTLGMNRLGAPASGCQYLNAKGGDTKMKRQRLEIVELEPRIAPDMPASPGTTGLGNGNPGNNNPGENNTNEPGNQPGDP